MADKAYWIGDDGYNKSVCIHRKIYVKGDEIPTDDVTQELLDEWKEKGLIAMGDKAAPIVVKDRGGLKILEAEVRDLKARLDARAGLEREVSDLKKAAEKAKTGAKAQAAKAKDDHIKELEDNAVKQSERIKELEDADLEAGAEIDALKLDNQEKAALIDKLNADIEALTNPESAGPGGSK